MEVFSQMRSYDENIANQKIVAKVCCIKVCFLSESRKHVVMIWSRSVLFFVAYVFPAWDVWRILNRSFLELERIAEITSHF